MRSQTSDYLASKFSFQDLSDSKESSIENPSGPLGRLQGRSSFKEDSRHLKWSPLTMPILYSMFCCKGGLGSLNFKLFEITTNYLYSYS